MKRHITIFFLGVALLFSFASSVEARTVGMVANIYSNSVTVFDTDTDTVLGVVTLPAGSIGINDVFVDSSGKLGVVSDSDNELYFIDLSATPPRLDDGINPVTIANSGRNISEISNGELLVTGEGYQPFSIVDTYDRQWVDTLSNNYGIDVSTACDNTNVSLLGISRYDLYNLYDSTLRQIMIHGSTGDTGETLPLSGEYNSIA